MEQIKEKREQKCKQGAEWVSYQVIGLLMVIVSCTSLLFLASAPNLSFFWKFVGFSVPQLFLYFVLKYLKQIGKA